MQFKVPVLI